MRVLVAQLNPTIGAFASNTKKIIASMEEARRGEADIVLCAEMALCGYPPEDLLLHRSFIEEMERYLGEIVGASLGLFVVVGLVRRAGEGTEKPLYNSAAVICDGKILGYYDKWLLPTYDVFDERRYFEPGKERGLWEYKGKKIAVTICEDIWQHAHVVMDTCYFKDPIETLVPLKPDFLLNLSASPFQFQKPAMRVGVCAAAAKTLRCPVIMCCQVGGGDDLVFDGYSVYVDGEGVLRGQAGGFEEQHMVVDLGAPIAHVRPRYDAERDLYSALVLGTRDYFQKQGFKKGCFGLSGGIDSALVACIAKDALGKENVLAVSMPSRYSSRESVMDAQRLAVNLDISFLTIPIEEPFSSFLTLLGPFFEGKEHNVTEENIQARIRSLILMAISNKLGHILLSTGNKSELALGFCTLYGDMSGGLSVISDVLKMQVYALCHWLNRERQIIPESILLKPPSAELKPNQKDTDTLPEYPIIDAVLEGYVEDLLSPEEIAQKNNIPLAIVKDLVCRIHKAEYKRRQAAPGIRVSKKSFSKGRRYPIVQKWV